MGILGNFYRLIKSYLPNKFHRGALNGDIVSWRPILADFLQGFILRPFLVVIYINDVPKGLKRKAKVFSGDRSILIGLSRIKMKVPLLQ